MKDNRLKHIQFAGVDMQIPENWIYETEEFKEDDGSRSYGLSMSARGRDVRCINLSWGPIPEGTNAYTEACATYEQVVNEEDLEVNNETIISFEFMKQEAHGFNVYSEDNLPCFFFCVEMPSAAGNLLLTVLLCGANNDELQGLLNLVEKHLSI